ncbi:MAG: ACT domain-containing protein, partial [Dehalococcoidia bacterium]
MTIRAEYPNMPGMLGRITSAIGEAGGDMAAVDVVSTSGGNMVRDFTVNTSGVDHGQKVINAINKVEHVKVRTVSDPTFLLHLGGK